MADKITVVANYGPFQSGAGGEFTVQPIGFAVSGYVSGVTSDLPGYDGTIQTFCAELTENIQPGTFEVFENVVTKQSNKVLTKGAAYLYYQFATGNLTGYNYGGTVAQRKASAAQLQNDLWALMNWPSKTLDPTSPWNGEIPANALLPNAGQYPVSILNVYVDGQLFSRLPQNNLQDVFVIKYGVPDGGLTVSLLGMALASLGVASRKLRK